MRWAWQSWLAGCVSYAKNAFESWESRPCTPIAAGGDGVAQASSNPIAVCDVAVTGRIVVVFLAELRRWRFRPLFGVLAELLRILERTTTMARAESTFVRPVVVG
jgi:hypothetical protein